MNYPKHQFKIKLSIVFLFDFILFLQSQSIKETFTYCDVHNLHRIVYKDVDCKIKERFKQELNFTQRNVWILSKNEYFINDFGYQCYKKKVIRYLNESIFFQKSDITVKYNLNLTRVECLAMVDSKKCENKDMICDENGCFYRKTPDGDYIWGKERAYVAYECAFHKKLVVAKVLNKALFSVNKSKCTVNELYCSLYDSIVIWFENMLNLFEYTKIHYGKNYNCKNNFVYSFRDQYLFEITNNIVYKNETFYTTTEGLYLYIEPQYQEGISLMKRLRFSTFRNKSLLIQRDINDLMLAENDFKEFVLQNSVITSEKNSLLNDCYFLQNQLQLFATISDKFFKINDLNGNNVVIYTKFNQIFIPDCVLIDAIEIRHEKQCFEDVPVKIQVKSKWLNVFLTSNNFLKSFSKIQDCSIINDRTILESLKNVIVRIGKDIKVMQVNTYNGEYLTIDYKNYTQKNYYHHDEIIKGYDFLNNFEQVNHLNDIEESFSILPDDQIETNSDFISKLLEAKNFLYNKVLWLQQFLYNSIILIIILCCCFVFFKLWRLYVYFKIKK